MTVAGRLPSRNARIWSAMCWRGSPASGITGAPAGTRPSVPWQMAQPAARLRACTSWAATGLATKARARIAAVRIMLFLLAGSEGQFPLGRRALSSCAARARRRRTLAEAPAVFDSEASEMRESPARSDFADAGGPTLEQLLTDDAQPVIAQVAHRRNAVHIAKVLEQGPPRHAGGLRHLAQRERLAGVLAYIVHRAADVARRKLALALAQGRGIVVRMRKQQTGHHQLLEVVAGQRVGQHRRLAEIVRGVVEHVRKEAAKAGLQRHRRREAQRLQRRIVEQVGEMAHERLAVDRNA